MAQRAVAATLPLGEVPAELFPQPPSSEQVDAALDLIDSMVSEFGLTPEHVLGSDALDRAADQVQRFTAVLAAQAAICTAVLHWLMDVRRGRLTGQQWLVRRHVMLLLLENMHIIGHVTLAVPEDGFSFSWRYAACFDDVPAEHMPWLEQEAYDDWQRRCFMARRQVAQWREHRQQDSSLTPLSYLQQARHRAESAQQVSAEVFGRHRQQVPARLSQLPTGAAEGLVPLSYRQRQQRLYELARVVAGDSSRQQRQAAFDQAVALAQQLIDDGAPAARSIREEELFRADASVRQASFGEHLAALGLAPRDFTMGGMVVLTLTLQRRSYLVTQRNEEAAGSSAAAGEWNPRHFR